MKRASKSDAGDGEKKQFPYRVDTTTLAQIALYAKRRAMSHNQFVQTAVDRLVDDEASKTGIKWEPFVEHPETPGWTECLLYGAPGMKLRKDEQDRKSFVLRFADFFFLGGRPNARTLDVLWPNLARYMATWESAKREGPIRKSMADDLGAADIPVPDAWREPKPADWQPG